MERVWLKVGEVAERLAVHPVTIRKMLARREIPFIKRPGIGVRIDWKRYQEELERSEVLPQRQQITKTRVYR